MHKQRVWLKAVGARRLGAMSHKTRERVWLKGSLRCLLHVGEKGSLRYHALVLWRERVWLKAVGARRLGAEARPVRGCSPCLEKGSLCPRTGEEGGELALASQGEKEGGR